MNKKKLVIIAGLVVGEALERAFLVSVITSKPGYLAKKLFIDKYFRVVSTTGVAMMHWQSKTCLKCNQIRS